MIDEAPESEYLVSTDEDKGLNLNAEVTATTSAGSTSAPSNQVPIDQGHNPFCEQRWNEQASPSVSGEAFVNGTLTTTNAVWDVCNSAIAGYRYQWLRDGTPISGATEQDYVVTEADLGHGISARVIAVYGLGDSLPSESNSSPVIGPEPPPEPPSELGPPPPFPTSSPCWGLFEVGGCDLEEPGTPAGGSPFNFGGKYVWTPYADIRGVRAGIRPHREHHFYLPQGNGAIMRVSAEAQRHLFQVGFGRTEQFPVGKCFDSPEPEKRKNYTFYESILPKPDGSPDQECEWINVAALGKSKLFTVYRKRVAPNNSNTTWQANINGRLACSGCVRDMGVDGMSWAIAGGEIVSEGPIYAFTYPDGRVFGCYGCTATPLGVIPWQRTNQSGSRSWFNVSGDAQDITDPRKTDGRWIVSPIPSGGGRFSVFHPCYEDGRLGCT